MRIVVIQLAKEAVGESGKVVAICSKKNISMVEALGADEVSATYIFFGVWKSKSRGTQSFPMYHKV